MAREPLVAPLHESEYDGVQVQPLLGEPVSYPPPVLLVFLTIHDLVLDQSLETVRQNVGRDPQVPLEPIEMADSKERLSQHQEYPAVPKYFGRPRYRALSLQTRRRRFLV